MQRSQEIPEPRRKVRGVWKWHRDQIEDYLGSPLPSALKERKAA